MTSEGILLRGVKNCKMLDWKTGEERWKYPFYQVYGSDSLKVLLGYKQPYSDKLRAISLHDGTELWKCELSHRYGWQQSYVVGPTKRLIVADNLHELDLLTGEIITHEAKTGVEDVKGALLQGLVSVATGVATGVVTGGAGSVALVPTANNVITHTTSNLLLEDSCYYIADRRCISCLDKQLQILWSTELPAKKSSCSQLFTQGDKLYMLNYGYALKNGTKKIKNGRPFIACYHKSTGEEIYFNQLTTQKDMIESAVLSVDETAYILFDDGLAYQHLTDSIVKISAWNTEKNGNLVSFLGDNLYREIEGAFVYLEPSTDYCMVYNEKGDVFEVDKELNIRTEYSLDAIYKTYYTLDGYRIIGNKKNFWLIHDLGMPIAKLTVDFRTGYGQGDTLWLMSTKNELLRIDLDKAL